jgi:hypothetical protein
MADLQEILRLTERATFSDHDHTTLHKLLAQMIELLNNALENGLTPGDQAQIDAIWAEIERIWEAINNIESQPGPPGPPGNTLDPMGVVPTPDDLPPNPDHMSVFIDQSTSHVWVYDPDSPAAGENGYVDMGQIGGMGPTPVPDQDSGWRDVSATLDAGWSAVEGNMPGLFLRRSGNFVAVRLGNLAAAPGATPKVFTLPHGFTRPAGWAESTPIVATGGIGGAALEVIGSDLLIRSVNLSAPGVLYSGQFYWLTDDEFPTVLPGVDV